MNKKILSKDNQQIKQNYFSKIPVKEILGSLALTFLWSTFLRMVQIGVDRGYPASTLFFSYFFFFTIFVIRDYVKKNTKIELASFMTNVSFALPYISLMILLNPIRLFFFENISFDSSHLIEQFLIPIIMLIFGVITFAINLRGIKENSRYKIYLPTVVYTVLYLILFFYLNS